MPLDLALSSDVAYCLKGNIAYPIVGASASAIATDAEARIVDAATDSGADQTERISAVTVANPVVVNQ